MPDTLHRFEIVNGKQIALLVAPVVGFALALVAVAARWYTRSTKRVNSLTEDALCLAALVMSFVVVALVYKLVFLCGEGLTSAQIRNDPTLDFDAVRRRWLRMQFAFDICWATSIATIQLAFLKFYVRLYATKALARIGCYVSMALILCWYLWSLVGWIVMCHPPGKCEIRKEKSCITIGSLHAAFNALILFAPLPAVIAAQLPQKKKAAFVLIFLLGCACTILAVLRIDCAIHVFGNVDTDPIGASWWRVCFSPIEIALGIICCCATNVSPRPLWNRERPSLPTESTGLRCLKFRTTSGSSSTSNLNPASWVGGPKPQVNAFVTLENSSKEMDGVGGVGGIKVTKDYQLDRGKI